MSAETRTALRGAKFLFLIGYCLQLGNSLLNQGTASDGPLWFRWANPLGMVVLGLWNWLLLKDWKDETNPGGFKIWTAVVHTKALLVAVTFTPLLEGLITRHTLNIFRASVLVVLALASSFSSS